MVCRDSLPRNEVNSIMMSLRLIPANSFILSLKVCALLVLTSFFLAASGETALAALACGDCHGYPPVDSATRDGATGRFPGSHDKHAGHRI